MKIYSYNKGSAGAKSLAVALNIKRIKHDGVPFNARGSIVINWGSSVFNRSILNARIINRPEQVALASNKLSSFKAMNGAVCTPSFTESPEEAFKWLLGGGFVVARHKLNGHSGEGIEILKPGPEADIEDLPKAPLYTKYIGKKEEYRIHVSRGKVFFVQRKARALEVPDDKINWQIRNHANGFIYANKDVEVADEAKTQAIMACNSLGLDFCAVDIILGVDRKWYVLEVNTAPGLTGTTLDRYVEMLKEIVNEPN